jgi:hypothetical protein
MGGGAPGRVFLAAVASGILLAGCTGSLESLRRAGVPTTPSGPTFTPVDTARDADPSASAPAPVLVVPPISSGEAARSVALRRDGVLVPTITVSGVTAPGRRYVVEVACAAPRTPGSDAPDFTWGIYDFSDRAWARGDQLFTQSVPCDGVAHTFVDGYLPDGRVHVEFRSLPSDATAAYALIRAA